ncbi:MAG TPA: hypothetical protein VG841_11325 [Caulobacterales bacterium]|nr:hypothetical protein [Caulobacterales bacterium]
MNFGRWFSQIKWLLVIAVFAGPAWAYFSYTEGKKIEHVMAAGVQTIAEVTGGEERTRRGVTTYNLDLAWADAGGLRHAATVDISSEFAHRVVVDGNLTIGATEIKYLAEDPSTIVLVRDAEQQAADKQLNMWIGAGAGLLGLVFAPLIFWWERKRAKKQQDDVDATLAQMRAGETPPAA